MDEESEFLVSTISKEIRKDRNLILPDGCLNTIPDLVLNPMGVAVHLGIAASGKFEPKNCVTYDLSFPGYFFAN